MKRFITSASLLFVGVVVGWWLRDVVAAKSLLPLQVPVSSSAAPIAMTDRTLPPAAADTTLPAPMSVQEASSRPTPERFSQLLSQRAFAQAIAYYENALDLDEGYQGLLKPRLEDYLLANLQQCADDAFVDLVGLWLQTYYEDIAVLLLLAQNQHICSSPEEAARTLQIARTYAIVPEAQESVHAAVAGLILATDQRLSQQQNWVELLGFYEFLQAIDLATRGSQLRRVSLYQRVGELQRSQELLSQLRASDDGHDSEWTAALDDQWRDSVRQSSADGPPLQAIPLTRQGDHFVVATYINDVNPVVLMIDTGASVTTLTRESFAQMDTAGLAFGGTRLFNTPNGRTQGEVYKAASITLGDTRASGLEIAVLDYTSSAGVDGLLGMNVLRNFHFEIDQDKNLLYLRPRR